MVVFLVYTGWSAKVAAHFYGNTLTFFHCKKRITKQILSSKLIVKNSSLFTFVFSFKPDYLSFL